MSTSTSTSTSTSMSTSMTTKNKSNKSTTGKEKNKKKNTKGKRLDVAVVGKVVRFGGEREPADGTPKDCDLVPVSDPDKLTRLLKEAGADPERDIAAKVVIPGRVRLVFVWYDAEAPMTSAWRIANQVVSLREDGERVRLRLDHIKDPVDRARVVTATSKAVYAAEFTLQSKADAQGPTSPVAFYGTTTPPGADLERLLSVSTRAADLENLPSNLLGPPEFVREVRTWFDSVPSVRATVLGPEQLADEGMGLVLGVGRGGERPPCMLILELRRKRDPKERSRRPLLVLIGKGVTYDAGGMAMKPVESMYGMHGDKTGASVAAAVLLALAQRHETDELPFDVVALLPTVENLMNEKAVRPGDVLKACDGTLVEIVNPDAEGRLILADAMAYAAKKYDPDFVIDFATLTGTATFVHPGISAVFHCEDDRVAKIVEDAGHAAGEGAWRLPVRGAAEYGYLVESSVADVRNEGWESNAMAAMAALFLRRFVPDPAKWLHLDLAANTWNSASPLLTTVPGEPMVGYGVVSGVAIASAIMAGRLGRG